MLINDLWSLIVTYNSSVNKKSPAFDEERETRLAEALLERNEKPAVKDFNFGATFKKVTVLELASKCDRHWIFSRHHYHHH